jgi:hypothetical protein
LIIIAARSPLGWRPSAQKWNGGARRPRSRPSTGTP